MAAAHADGRPAAAKADTSGTAKALVASFQKLGPKFEVDEIVKVRDAEQQLKMGVPGAWCHVLGRAASSGVSDVTASRGAPGGSRIPHVPADFP